MTAQQISDKIIKKSGINIFEHSRKRHIIQYRSLLIHILRDKLNMRWVSIAMFFKANDKNMTEASIIHSYDHFPIYQEQDKNLKQMLEEFNFKPIDIDVLDKIHYLNNKIKNLTQKLEKYEKIA